MCDILECYRFSLERRWSIHSFRYGCLVTTSPLSSILPWSLLWNRAFGYYRLSWCDGRWVQDPRTYSPWHSWFTITSDSNFMRSSCRPQSELRTAFWDWLHLAVWLPFVLSIVARVLPRASKGHADLTSSPPSSQNPNHKAYKHTACNKNLSQENCFMFHVSCFMT